MERDDEDDRVQNPDSNSIDGGEDTSPAADASEVPPGNPRTSSHGLDRDASIGVICRSRNDLRVKLIVDIRFGNGFRRRRSKRPLPGIGTSLSVYARLVILADSSA